MRVFLVLPALLILFPVTAWSQASSSGTLQLPGGSAGPASRPAPAAAPRAQPPGRSTTPSAGSSNARRNDVSPGTASQSGTARGGAGQNATSRGTAATGPVARRPAARAAAGAAAGAAAVGAAAVAPAAPPAPTPPPEPQETVGSVTGLPLPRFAPLRSDEVNLRTGPGTRFPIEWTYQRRDLPVQITREFDQWRRIRMQDGTEGWVHHSNLALGRRSFTVGASVHTIRRRPEDGAAAVARLEPGVVGRVRACAAGNTWCEVQVGDHRGYLKRSEMFGVTADEVIGN